MEGSDANDSLATAPSANATSSAAPPPAKRQKQVPPALRDLKTVLNFHFSGPKRIEGRVKWFDKEKGFGKIVPVQSRGQLKAPEEIFVHRKNIEGGVDGLNYAALVPGALVTYELTKHEDGKQCAGDVRCEGFAKIMQNDLADAAEEENTVKDLQLHSLVLHCLRSGSFQEVGKGKVLMEDRFVQGASREVGMLGNSRKEAACAFFGVFDGHAGASCSDFVALHLERNVFDCLREQKKRDASSEIALRSALLAGFKVTEHNFQQYAHKLEGGASRAWATSGSTACTATLFGPDEDGHLKLLVANIGDSRAILGKKDGLAVRLSTDHKPGLQSEKKRVEQQGGTVAQFGGTWRVILKTGRGQVTSGLSVTRSFGDVDFKTPQEVVTAVPEISSFVIDPEDDLLLILASDGVFESLSDVEAVRLASNALRDSEATAAAAPGKAAELLVQTAHTRNPVDDKTALVVWFGATPAPEKPGVAPPAAAASSMFAGAGEASTASMVDLTADTVELPAATEGPTDDIFAAGADPMELALLDDIFSGYARELGMPEEGGKPREDTSASSRTEEGKGDGRGSKKKVLSNKVAKKVF